VGGCWHLWFQVAFAGISAISSLQAEGRGVPPCWHELPWQHERQTLLRVVLSYPAASCIPATTCFWRFSSSSLYASACLYKAYSCLYKCFSVNMALQRFCAQRRLDVGTRRRADHAELLCATGRIQCWRDVDGLSGRHILLSGAYVAAERRRLLPTARNQLALTAAARGVVTFAVLLGDGATRQGGTFPYLPACTWRCAASYLLLNHFPGAIVAAGFGGSVKLLWLASRRLYCRAVAGPSCGQDRGVAAR